MAKRNKKTKPTTPAIETMRGDFGNGDLYELHEASDGYLELWRCFDVLGWEYIGVVSSVDRMDEAIGNHEEELRSMMACL